MTDAEELAQLRVCLAELEAERAHRRDAYEAIGIGSLDPAFLRATYAHAVADMWCWRVEEQIKAIERRTKRAA